jgi:hypothetical protein
MVRLDKFISGVRNGCLLQDNDFELLDYDPLGHVSSVSIKVCMSLSTMITCNGRVLSPHLPSPVIWMRFAGPNG